MTQTRWAVASDNADETGLEIEGRRFSSNDEGGPMMCNQVCSSMGRHVHIDYCRTEDNTSCEGAELQHIEKRMVPNPQRPKDAVTHSLYWRRMGTLVISCLVLFRVKVRLQASKVMVTPSLSQVRTEIENQIHILETNRRILLNGVLSPADAKETTNM
jgi:hypothetical protein